MSENQEIRICDRCGCEIENGDYYCVDDDILCEDCLPDDGSRPERRMTMCALFGYLDYGHQLSPKVLQKLVQALANASEVRGNHASGIAYNRDNHLTVFKRPKPAHKLKFRLPDGTAAVMGHTRFTTQGCEKQNYNNHPFRGNAGTDFALAHTRS